VFSRWERDEGPNLGSAVSRGAIEGNEEGGRGLDCVGGKEGGLGTELERALNGRI
jgi:hypothetical protein